MAFTEQAIRNPSERNRALSEALREIGRSATPHELEERGVRRVRCVPMEHVSLLIDKAVEKALLGRAPAGEEFGTMLDHAQASMLELLEGVNEVEQSRGSIQQQRLALEDELAMLRRDRDRGGIGEDPIAWRDREIDRLERRVAKLLTSLEATEEVLKRVSAMKNLEFGIESIYRMVQGLGDSDDNVALKREMMERIFQANIALQAQREQMLLA